MSETTSKFNVKHTFLIGLAFFSAEIAWALYNAQVPLLLKEYIPSLFMVGAFMALDNIIGVIVQPIMGSISDNTRTKFGRRMPYILVGVPLGALLFALIPTETSLLMLFLWMLLFGIVMGSYRAQAVALMPDFVKPVNRSKGNGVINLMGGLGVTIGYGMSYLIDAFSSVTVGRQVTFLIVSIIMILAVIVLFWKVKEQDAYSYKLILEIEEKEGMKVKEEKKKPGLIESIIDIKSEDDKSTLFILLAVFFWYIGYQGILALVSIYGVHVLGYSEGLAGFIPFFVSVPLILTVYPLGIVSTKIGRRKAIKIGIIIWIIMLIVTFFLGFMSVSIAIFAIPIAILGPGWALINVNSIVIVWELAPNEQKIGTYTGLYYFFSFLAAIIGPMIIGGLTDLFTHHSLLLNGAFFFIIAFIMMLFVKRGEAELTEQEKIAKEKAIQEL